ncbi:hypothetical protein L195_g035192 [Trifolium pratense]|uniref:Uncharacterized protein n=1 Tax=Trifolium pratense TaxID=57577 RepID=A0A2K3LKY2_TRIPR|nr:hypothetical protein L195_g035192 [Trifolium pratense]
MFHPSFHQKLPACKSQFVVEYSKFRLGSHLLPTLKDGASATEEFKTKIEIDEWREWEGWRVGGRQGYGGGGDKEGRHGGGSKGKGEHNENGRDNKIGHIGEGWELKGTRGWGQRGDSENEVRKRHP